MVAALPVQALAGVAPAGRRRKGVEVKHCPRNTVILFCLALLAVGCGERPAAPPAAVPSGGEDAAARLREAEAAIARLKREHEADLAAQAFRLEREIRAEFAAALEEAEGRIADERRTVGELERTVARQEAEIRTLQRRAEEPPVPPPVPARVSVFEPPRPPVDGAVDFPLRVFAVQGRNALAGSHASMRFVTTDETYRDRFGQVRSAREAAEVEMPEYRYEVAFSVENLSDRPQTFSMRAGSVSRTVHLQPHAVHTTLSINAAIGAPLVITTESHRRRFEVTPPSSAE